MKKGTSFWRAGISLMLAVVLAAGLTPVVASASVADDASANAAELLAVGDSQTVDITWVGTGDFASGGMYTTATTMAAQYLGSTAELVVTDTGYNLVLTCTSDKITKLVLSDESEVELAEDMTFTIPITSIDDPIDIAMYIGGAMEGMFPGGVTLQIYLGEVDLPEAEALETEELENAIASAEAIEQGEHSTAAYTALQSAISSAKEVLNSSSSTQDDIDSAVSALASAVSAYENDSTVVTNDGYVMLEGATYTLPVSFYKTDGSGDVSMSSQFMNSTVKVVYTDGYYYVTITLKDDTVFTQFSDFYLAYSNGKAADYDATTLSYTFKLSSIDSAVTIIAANMAGSNQSVYMVLNTKSLTKDDGTSGTSAASKVPSSSTSSTKNSSSSSSSTASTQSSSSAAFEAGHTYSVPLTFKKSNSSETSMTAQYFGSTALVRVSDDGKYLYVYFTTNNASEIQEISSAAGYSLTVVSSNSSANTTQYCMTIPYTESNVVTAIQFGVATMRTLMSDSSYMVSADMYLYLARATDLGTDADDLEATSISDLSETGDSTGNAALPVALLAALAAGAMAVSGVRMRRRDH